MIADGTKTNVLSALFEEYMSQCQYSKGLRPQTLKSYREVFQTLQKVVPELVTTDDLNSGLIHEFFKRLSIRKRISKTGKIGSGVKPSTIRTYYNRLISFFRWLENENYIPEKSVSKSVIKPPAPTYEDDRALSDKEVSKIISSITLHTRSNQFLYVRDLAIVHTLLFTGIRKGELLGLRVHDIDFVSRTLFVNGTTSKSKKSRKVPLHPTLIIYLASYLQQRERMLSTSEHLWVSWSTDGALTQHGLKHWVEKYKSLSGVPFHLHRFRHTFACNLAKNKADVVSIKNVMGHSSIRMTERYLRSISSENSRSFIETLSC